MLRRLSVIFLFLSSVAADRPLIIAHRGSSGEYPDLTMEGFRTAANQGSDLIELDLCVSKDGQLIVIHEPALSLSTNVAEKTEFRGRKRSVNVTTTAKSIGWPKWHYFENDWFVMDFTLSELRRIQKRQRDSFRNPTYDGKFQIPTFFDVLNFVKHRANIGLLIELKVPSFFNRYMKENGISNTSMERMVFNDLRKFGFDVAQSGTPRIIVQTFEEDSVLRMLNMTKLPVILLQQYGYPNANDLLNWKHKGLYGIGSYKLTLLALRYGSENDGAKQTFNFSDNYSDIVHRSHAIGLKVIVWTFRNEDRFLPWNFGNDPIREFQTFLRFGIDGFITDFPATLKFILDCSGKRLVTSNTLLIIAIAVIFMFK